MQTFIQIVIISLSAAFLSQMPEVIKENKSSGVKIFIVIISIYFLYVGSYFANMLFFK